MYDARPTLRWLLAFGCLGLAALFTTSFVDADAMPVWVMVALVTAPIGLAELGGGIAEEASTLRRARLGWNVQVGGALLFILLFVSGVFLAVHEGVLNLYLVVMFVSPGLLASAVLLADRIQIARGREPFGLDAVGAGLRLRQEPKPGAPAGSFGRLRDSFTVIGGETLLMGVIAIAFVTAAVWIGINRPESRTDPMLILVVLFFGTCGLVAVSTALQRWSMRVGGERAHAVQRSLLLIALFGFAISLLGMGVLGGDIPMLWRIVFVAFGALLLALLPLVVTKKGGFGLATVLVPTREGLLERSRSWTVLEPWSRVADVAVGELYGNAALLVWLDQTEGIPRILKPHGEDKVKRTEHWRAKALQRARRFSGVDLVMTAVASPEPLADVSARFERALDDPDWRQALPNVEELTPFAKDSKQ
ncbi:MAG: hypothetical protein ACR2RB_06295 [Gammaproteobacteria bacterium]